MRCLFIFFAKVPVCPVIGYWLNDHVSKFGYEHRGLRLKYRDWDTPQGEANAGKTYSTPGRDVFLRDHAHRLPTVAALFQKLHPGERYYLTNIQAVGLKPETVRQWSDDLWLFPYYIDPKFVPYDARPGGPSIGRLAGRLIQRGEFRGRGRRRRWAGRPQCRLWRMAVAGGTRPGVGGPGRGRNAKTTARSPALTV